MRNILFAYLVLLFQASSMHAQTLPICSFPNSTASDECSTACIFCQLNGFNGQTTGYTAGAAPGFCSTVHNDQWLGFIAGADSIEIEVAPYNCQEGNGVEIALYADCASAPIACIPGFAGGGSQARVLSAPLVSGQTYFLMINGYAGDACQFSISTSPANAVFEPQVGPIGPVQGPLVVAEQSTAVYSVDPVANATSYRWTGPSSFTINGQTPPVNIPAPAGTQVTVTVGSKGGIVGAQALNPCSESPVANQRIFIGKAPLAPPCPTAVFPATDFCGDACVFCNFSGYSGTTGGYTAGSAPGFCGILDNDQWIGFVASAPTATFQLTASDCENGDGLQFALYQNCTDPPLACANGNAGGAGDTLSITATLQPGQNYFLMVDGYNGDQCAFNIAVDPPMAAQTDSLDIPGPILGPNKVCPGATVTYTVPPVDGAAGYTWHVPPAWLINGAPGPYTGVGAGSNTVTVTTFANSGQLTVFAFNSCAAGSPVFKNIISAPIPPTDLSPVVICAEDLPCILPWGDSCFSSGLYFNIYSSYLGCDSVVRQQVTVNNPIINTLPPITICAGEEIMICNTIYTSTGTYSETCESYMGCDSVLKFTLIVSDPVAKILLDDSLFCTNPVLLNSAPSPGVKSWKRLNGSVIGSGNTLTVTESGVYILEVAASAGSSFCMDADTVSIQLNDPPHAMATGGTLTCSQTSVQLDGMSNTAGALFSWSGPNGFVSNEEDPEVAVAGDYLLTVTDPLTGCTSTASATVLGDTVPPTLPVLNDVFIDCTTPSYQLLCPMLVPVAVCEWSGPGISDPNEPDPVVDVPGTYQLTVTGPNGCTSTTEFQVLADFQIPVLTAYADTITCTNPTSTVHCSVDIPGSTCTWEDIGNGIAFLVTATAPNGCMATDTVIVQIDTGIPDLTVADDTLNCIQTSVVLICNTNTAGAIFEWTGPGNFSSTLQSPTVFQPGTYIVTVTDPSNGCASIATATVFEHTQLPEIIATPPDILTCAMPIVTLHFSTNVSQAAFLWVGPNGFTSDLPSPDISEPGLYTLTVVAPGTGCSSQAAFQVVQDTAAPGVSATGGTLSCAQPQVQLMGASASPAVNYAWTGPGIGLPVPSPNPIVNMPGVYTLLTTAANGCTSVDTALVSTDPSPFLISMQTDTLDCGTDSIYVELPQLPGFPPTWISIPGTYSFSVPNPVIGCETVVELLVPQDVQAPTIDLVQLQHDQNGQGLGAIDISVDYPGAYTLVWSLNGVFYSNSEDLSGLMAGTYEVVVTGSNDCTSTQQVTVLDSVNTATHSIPSATLWEVFPNPASDFLQLNYRGQGQPAAQVWMLDAAGKVVLKPIAVVQAELTLSCAHVPAGMYMVVISTKDGLLRKLVAVLR
jgi:hypothetical protein